MKTKNNTRNVLIALITSLALLATQTPASACTRVVYVAKDGTIITGRSMDWGEDMFSDMWVLPRGMKRDGMGGANTVTWESKYGSLVVSAYGISGCDGMNEKGLVVNMLALVESNYGKPAEGGKVICMSTWAQYILDLHSNVADAVADLRKEEFSVQTIVLPTGRPANMHLAISDANGDSAIFEYVNGKRLSDQFAADRGKLAAEYVSKGLKPALIEQQLNNHDKYDFFVPLAARWSAKDEQGRNTGVAHLKTSVGSGLNKALAAIEDANPNTLQDVLKGINFNRKVGQRSMDDDTLVAFIQHFNDISLANDDFEFPDLLGAAYEYLIKYFADSAGKKGGEFYTPSEVVRMMVQLIEPKEGMGIYDPCAGSGGMLIQSKQYVQEVGGDARNLELAGQELNGGTWAICKMNLLLHGVRSADVRQGDTIKAPQHLDKQGEIRSFDRVIANPPFSQNYARNGMQFAERFHTFLPESGKKADLMFVQHMVASLKSDGRMAVVMPHGVLFRGGEEKACRQKFIKDGNLDAVIGLPAGLFYGTGIPACVLVINKHGSARRKSVLFINADRECKAGKNQNSLPPEDIEKITHVYRHRLSVPKYSREVPVEELEREEFNLNIRRYVDNSPPPEPHDVRAHLHGGIPVSEIASLTPYFDNYAGLRSLLFQDRDAQYSDCLEGHDGLALIGGIA